MKKIKQLTVLLSMVLVVVSCTKKLDGDGPVVTEERTLPQFTGVIMKVPANTTITQGTNFKVELEGHSNILNEIETVISGSDLVFRFRRNINLRSSDEPVMRITMPATRKAELHGSGSMTLPGTVSTDFLELLVNGSGNLHVADLDGGELKAKTNGSGKIRVSEGNATRSFCEVNGSGDIEIADVLSARSEVGISGSGKVLVNVLDELKVRISGSGSVRYRGNPVINSNISGSGSVKRL